MNLRTFILPTVLACSFGLPDVQAGSCDAWRPGPLLSQPQGVNGIVLCSTLWAPPGGAQLLVVGGNFTTAGGVTCNNLAAWDGASWKALGTGTNHSVHSMAVFNGDLIIGGRFTMVNGLANFHIARYNGQDWLPLSFGVGLNNTDESCKALVVHNGELYAGGKFTIAGTAQCQNIAKWNGSAWSALVPNGGVSSPNPFADEVRSLYVHNNVVYLGGWFANATGVGAVNNIASYSGGAFSAMGSGANNFVNAFGAWNGELIVGGSFSSVNGMSAGRVARWTGAAWGTMGAGVGGSGIYSFMGFNGQLVAGVEFTNFPSMAWNGSSWVSLGASFTGGSPIAIYTLNYFGGEMHAAGNFTSAGGFTATSIAKWNTAAWSALQVPYPSVSAMTLMGNRIVAGGVFRQSTTNQANANNLIAFDGVTKTRLATTIGGGEGINGRVRALKSFTTAGPLGSRYLIAGGEFTAVAGLSANYVAQYQEPPFTPAEWSAMGLGFDGPVYAIERFNNATYAGGFFTMSGATSVNRIARWTGSAWAALGSGMNGTVWALKVYNGALYAGGDFTSAGGVNTGGLARWTGTTWEAIGQAFNGTVYALEVHNNELVIGGVFPGLTGNPNIARYNITAYFTLGSGGVNGPVTALTSNGANLYVSGGFTSAGGVAASNIARWSLANGWSAVTGGINNGLEGPTALASFHGEVHVGLSIGVTDAPEGTGAPNPGQGWVVYSETGAPWVAYSPFGQSVECGGFLEFEVTAAAGYTVSYQWRRNGTPVSNGPTPYGSFIAGADTNTLLIANAKFADAGSYDCVVSNACGSANSIAATLTVNNCCQGECTGNGIVDIDDLLQVINAWGPCNGCPPDMNNSGAVNIDDMLLTINGWGACP